MATGDLDVVVRHMGNRPKKFVSLMLTALATVQSSNGCPHKYGPVQEPKGVKTSDPATLPHERVESGIKYEFPSGWQLVLEDGFRIVATLPEDRPLLYKDNCCVLVLDGGAPKPRTMYQARAKNALAKTPSWSPDGRHCYEFFDCTIQLVEIDTNTSEMTPLTKFKVHRNYKGAPHFEPVIHGPFLFDEKGKRILYFEVDYAEPHDAQLVAISLPDHQRVPVSRKLDLSGYPYWWRISPRHGRLFTKSGRDNKVEAWSFEGKHLASIELQDPFGSGLELSADETTLLFASSAVSDRRPTNSERPTVAIKEIELPHGRCYTWSPDGTRVAFLRRAEEVWMHDTASGETQKLAEIKPRSDAPEWSRDRHFTLPVWSQDGRMMSAGLSSYAGPEKYVDYVTLLFDFQEKTVVVLPWRIYCESWSPIPKPFPKPFHIAGIKPEGDE